MLAGQCHAPLGPSFAHPGILSGGLLLALATTWGQLTLHVAETASKVEHEGMADPQDMMRRPGGGVSRATVKKLIKQFAKGAPARAVLPVFDTTEGSGPGLAYQVQQGDDLEQIIILGENLTGITVVDVSTDVVVGGSPGDPPVVGILTVTDTSIVVPLDATDSIFGAKWGIILRDAAGNVYDAPSPIAIWGGD